MSELTYEQSVEAAKPIKEMAELARTLNVEYLSKCLDEMRSQNSFRESASILSPNPFTVNEQNDLNRAKQKGLELMIELAKNQEEIFRLTVKLAQSKRTSNDLAKMFGL